jgi:hypothetical protein
MEANTFIDCNFDVIVKNEKYHINRVWRKKDGNPCWWEGSIIRDGVEFMRIFGPDEITIPEIYHA